MISWLTSSQINEIFADEMNRVRGKVTDAIDIEERLFARAVLPPSVDVAPGDKLQGGVALRSTDADIFIHPYILRIVCTNGAIMAQATQTRHISRDNWFTSPDCAGDLETQVREAIRCCTVREAFVFAADQMRSARERTVDMAVTLAGFMSTHRNAMPKSALMEVLRRYDRGSESSAYGLMNAVTSVARDTRDPDMKWRLETLGGSIAATGRLPVHRPGRSRAARPSVVEVG